MRLAPLEAGWFQLVVVMVVVSMVVVVVIVLAMAVVLVIVLVRASCAGIVVARQLGARRAPLWSTTCATIAVWRHHELLTAPFHAAQ